MAEAAASPEGPDLAAGVPASDLREGIPFPGRVGDEAVVLVRRNGTAFALGASCTHYGGPLAKGLVVGDTLRCPWHHACFDLRTGGVLGGPALDPVPVWTVEERAGVVRVTGRLAADPTPPQVRRKSATPESVVIVGGGCAGHNAAEELRRRGFERPVTIVDPDPDSACDRPNLSKDYLAGKAPEAWLHLRPAEYFTAQGLDRKRAAAVAIEPGMKRVRLDDGALLEYGALILAPGAAPVAPGLPGNGGPPVFTLRTVSDSRAIVAAASESRRAVVMGASFIGLEVAASLRARGLEVIVVAPGARPFERIFGDAVGDLVRQVHEEHGVQFRLGRTAAAITARGVRLSDGEELAADLVVAGVGVRPNLALAESAGLRVDNGVVVDAQLAASAPGVWAAGDAARYPDPRSGQPVRIEHWVVAGRQGRTAARNALGLGEPFRDVPFFWTWQHDLWLGYEGHAERWDELVVEGTLESRRALVRYRADGRDLAVLAVNRSRKLLEVEVELERLLESAHPR